MFNRIHTYTTSRIAPKTVALLAVYAVAVELLARLFGVTAALAFSAVSEGRLVELSELESILISPILFGWQPVAVDVVTGLPDPGVFLTILIPFFVVGYTLAIGVVYGVHRRYVV